MMLGGIIIGGKHIEKTPVPGFEMWSAIAYGEATVDEEAIRTSPKTNARAKVKVKMRNGDHHMFRIKTGRFRIVDWCDELGNILKSPRFISVDQKNLQCKIFDTNRGRNLTSEETFRKVKTGDYLICSGMLVLDRRDYGKPERAAAALPYLSVGGVFFQRAFVDVAQMVDAISKDYDAIEPDEILKDDSPEQKAAMEKALESYRQAYEDDEPDDLTFNEW